METLTSKQIREWGAEVGRREHSPTDTGRLCGVEEFALQTTQIQATLEVAAQLADLRETLEPNRLRKLSGDQK